MNHFKRSRQATYQRSNGKTPEVLISKRREREDSEFDWLSHQILYKQEVNMFI